MKAKILKRVMTLAFAQACIGLLISGCSVPESMEYFTPDETSDTISEAPASVATVEYSDEEIDEIAQTYYGYNMLDGENQILYLEMLEALEDMKDDVALSTLDISRLDDVFNCLMNDHPELFYVTGYRYTEYTLGGSITSLTFSGTYSMTQGQVSSTKPILDAKINECLMYAPDGMDQYFVAKYLYEWVIDNTEYDMGAENNQNICSVFLTGQSVCQGYAKALQYMLQKSGIESFIVTGYTGGERHAWDLAKINGQYYYLDPTWGDASYSYNGDSASIYDFAPSINYDYFLVTTDELAKTHVIEQVVELPTCDDLSDNYFVREGLYFTEYDADRLAAIFDRYDSRQQGYVTIKCSDDAYTQVSGQLIDEQKIFDFVDAPDASIAYTSNSELGTISFWNIY